MPRSRRSAVDSDGSDRRQRAGWNLLNGTIDVNHPQALIYEPSPNGKMKLVGVEFITFASAWAQNNSSPPVPEGQVFLYVDSPNRIPAFFELHVWAWRDNPQGDF